MIVFPGPWDPEHSKDSLQTQLKVLMRGHCSLRVQEVCLSEYTGSKGSFCRVRLGTLEKFYKPTILYKQRIFIKIK